MQKDPVWGLFFMCFVVIRNIIPLDPRVSGLRPSPKDDREGVSPLNEGIEGVSSKDDSFILSFLCVALAKTRESSILMSLFMDPRVSGLRPSPKDDREEEGSPKENTSPLSFCT